MLCCCSHVYQCKVRKVLFRLRRQRSKLLSSMSIEAKVSFQSNFILGKQMQSLYCILTTTIFTPGVSALESLLTWPSPVLLCSQQCSCCLLLLRGHCPTQHRDICPAASTHVQQVPMLDCITERSFSSAGLPVYHSGGGHYSTFAVQ